VLSTLGSNVATSKKVTIVIPFLSPNPPKLSEYLNDLKEIEDSGWFSNNGPINQKFERQIVSDLFGGDGHVATVCNATIGLMISIKEAIDISSSQKRGKYALIPSFTFAATAHAAIWCGLTPLLYDVDIDTWLPSQKQEQHLLEKYGDEIGILIPYATFGNNLDLGWYKKLSEKYDVPVVVDAAASLGSVCDDGRGFGSKSNFAIVYSMHVTKTFSTSEAGLIYSNSKRRIERIRAMANFGFSSPREAHLPGLNAKLSEIGALIALKKLDNISSIVNHREKLYSEYRKNLPQIKFQKVIGQNVAHQFVPIMLPKSLTLARDGLINQLAAAGYGTAKYFSPHLAEQPYFLEHCVVTKLSRTEDISKRMLSLPLSDKMTTQQVATICEKLRNAIARLEEAA
jgi:dTDP-4-amino-4,6-dideoxygalactose transaminase